MSNRNPNVNVRYTELSLYDFKWCEAEQYFRPVFIDPDRHDVFLAFYPHFNQDRTEDTSIYETRSLSTQEYYELSGAPRRSRQLERRKMESGIKGIEIAIPPISGFQHSYDNYMDYILQNLQTLFAFYSNGADRLLNYIGRQRAMDQSVNIIINGGIKPNVPQDHSGIAIQNSLSYCHLE